ncbi:MAG: phytanoyl-CoA dioxygenase family protein [Phycisphaeraceae bacterium]
MSLTPEQQRQFYKHGFLHIPGAVPVERVERCRRKIHHSIGSRGMDPSELTNYRARSYCPELQNDPDFTQLVRCEVPWQVLNAALGQGNVDVGEWVQIALRFPTMADDPGPAKWHVDGVPTRDNGAPPDRVSHFTCLLGVVLADVPAPGRGNLTVWPGGHHKMEQWFRDNPVKKLLEGYPDLDLADPHPTCARAGDAFMVHYLTPHGVTPNVGPDPRYMVFFRIKHARHAEFGDDCLTDAWLEWPGVRDVVEAAPA